MLAARRSGAGKAGSGAADDETPASPGSSGEFPRSTCPNGDLKNQVGPYFGAFGFQNLEPNYCIRIFIMITTLSKTSHTHVY